MKSISDLQVIIEQGLRNINISKTPENLYSPIDYVIKLGGKRLRPTLMLIAHQLFDKDIQKALSPSLGIEIFHNFTLLHDDIMDKALLRRGKSTVHEKWSTNVAILSGDTMLVHAYKLLSDVDKSIIKEVLTVFNKTATQVCEGQQWDMDFETQSNVTLPDYIKMIEYKTAVLLAGSLQIGGITGGANIEEQKHLYEFGRNLGIAFQLKDDLLDAFGDSDTFGKKIGGDIIGNKKTFLYLKALQLADTDTKKTLQSFFLEIEPSEKKVETVISIFEELNIPKHTIDMMKAYYIKAMKHLNAIDTDNKAPLISLSESLMDRIS
tara:strand:+ start:1101 stop:2066 length:966 start_codon:yes stop_codon:yes gene_type:complete